jgi:hypothetical protein
MEFLWSIKNLKLNNPLIIKTMCMHVTEGVVGECKLVVNLFPETFLVPLRSLFGEFHKQNERRLLSATEEKLLKTAISTRLFSRTLRSFNSSSHTWSKSTWWKTHKHSFVSAIIFPFSYTHWSTGWRSAGTKKRENIINNVNCCLNNTVACKNCHLGHPREPQWMSGQATPLRWSKS